MNLLFSGARVFVAQGDRRYGLSHWAFAESRPIECSAGHQARQATAAYPILSSALVAGNTISPQPRATAPLRVESLSNEARLAPGLSSRTFGCDSRCAGLSAASAAEIPVLALGFGPSTTARPSSPPVRLFAGKTANSGAERSIDLNHAYLVENTHSRTTKGGTSRRIFYRQSANQCPAPQRKHSRRNTAHHGLQNFRRACKMLAISQEASCCA
jgi:hypothetical protein